MLQLMERLISVLASICLWMSLSDCSIEHDRLYTKLVSDYNKNSLPGETINDTLLVTIEFGISSMNKFDEVSGELSMSMMTFLTWTDNRLAWTREDYGGASSILVEPSDIWIPQLYVIQPFDNMITVGRGSMIRVFNNGTVNWNIASVMRISCSVNVATFPFDTQICPLSVSGWMYFSSELVLYSRSRTLSSSYYTRGSQWELLDSPVSNCFLGDNYYQGPSLVMVEVTFKRLIDFYMVYIMIPIMLLGLLNMSVFLMPASSGERNSVAVTMFLSFAVFMQIVKSRVPASSSPLANIYYYFLFLLVFSCLILVLGGVSMRLNDRSHMPPRSLQRLVFYLTCRQLRLQKVCNHDDGDVMETESRVSEISSDAIQGLSNDENNTDPLYENINWKVCCNVIDKFLFILMFVVYVIITIALFTTILIPSHPVKEEPFMVCQNNS